MAVGLLFGFGDPDEDLERVRWCSSVGCDEYIPCCIEGHETIGFCSRFTEFVEEQLQEDGGDCVW